MEYTNLTKDELISKTKKLEQEVSGDEDNYRSTFERTSVGIAHVSGKGSIFRIILNKVKISSFDVLTEEETVFEHDAIHFEESTILIVDDIKTNRDVLTGYISDYKLNIIEAQNGKEASTAIEKNKPDLVFLDLRMPVMDGY